jgi:hypothetical protein
MVMVMVMGMESPDNRPGFWADDSYRHTVRWGLMLKWPEGGFFYFFTM